MRSSLLRHLLAMSLLAVVASSSFAQLDGKFQVLPELGQFTAAPSEPNLAVTAQVRVKPGESVGILEVTAKFDEPWHIYSLTQPAGGPLKSKIILAPSEQYRLLGSFAPARSPDVHYVETFKMNSEEFAGQVSWSAPIELLSNESSLKIVGSVEGQACADAGCIPFDERETAFVATVQGQLTQAETASLIGFKLPKTHSPIRSWLSRSEVRPGETVSLYVAFNPDPNWHVYAYAKLPPSPFQKPTLIQSDLPDGWTMGEASSASPIISEEGLPNDPPIRYYEGAATIRVPITIPKTAKVGAYPVTGYVAYQTCAKQCDRPVAIAWNSQLNVVAQPSSTSLGAVAFAKESSSYDSVIKLLESNGEKAAATRGTAEPATSLVDDNAESGVSSSAGGLANVEFEVDESQAKPASITSVLLAAFVGGFILNFMPCVLPVIGLKILSFVDQAGSDRGKIFKLNLWYSIGMIAIFWVLAVLAAAPALGLAKNGLGWGEQFNNQPFVITLICVVFTMGLSFLGIWEIPIPGFATSNKASELTAKDGYSGAFFKGAITTVLATPCSAPGLGLAYAFAVKSGSPTLPFLIFTVMGLGMAMPYLLIGAFPGLIKFLPKPGAWMDTFKQLMGFVLLATVIFLMQNLSFQNLLPTVALLFGLWFACWWIGRVPFTAEPSVRARAWAISVVIGLIAAVFSFAGSRDVGEMTLTGLFGVSEEKYNDAVLLELARSQSEANSGGVIGERLAKHTASANSLPWEPYTTRSLDEMIKKEATVLVDFTADW